MLRLRDHFPPEVLHQRYRSAKDPVERSHWQIIWLRSQGQSTAEIAQALGYSQPWIRELIQRYNQQGEPGLVDHRHQHPGAPALLSPEALAELDHALEDEAAPDGGPWTGPKVARWIEQKTGRDHVHDQRGWEYLLRLGFTTKTPRPRHQHADPQAQQAFKK
jgi:transposase